MQQYQHAIEILSDSATETYHFCILGIARFRGREERLERDEAGSEGKDGTPARLEDVEADEAGLGRDVCGRRKMLSVSQNGRDAKHDELRSALTRMVDLRVTRMHPTRSVSGNLHTKGGVFSLQQKVRSSPL